MEKNELSNLKKDDILFSPFIRTFIRVVKVEEKKVWVIFRSGELKEVSDKFLRGFYLYARRNTTLNYDFTN